MEQQLTCPNCSAADVTTKIVTVNRRTGRRINKVVSLVASIGMLSLGGCMLFSGITMAISGDMPSALWLNAILAALFLVPGAIVLVRYLRADKVQLTEYACAACKHTWKEVAGEDGAVEGALEAAQPQGLVTLEGWQPAVLGGQPIAVQIELAPGWALLTIPGRKVRIPKEGAGTKVVFPDAPYSGKGKTEHLDGLPVVHVENVKNIILQPEAYQQLRAWVPPATVKDRLKKELRGWGGSLIFAGFASLAYASTLSPIWGGVLIVLGVLNLIIAHRAMFILNGIGLIVAAIMNVLGGGLWIALGILQFVWAIAEFRKFAQYAE
jgi:hypothetical protein